MEINFEKKNQNTIVFYKKNHVFYIQQLKCNKKVANNLHTHKIFNYLIIIALKNNENLKKNKL